MLAWGSTSLHRRVFSGLSPLLSRDEADEGERIIVRARTPQEVAVCWRLPRQGFTGLEQSMRCSPRGLVLSKASGAYRRNR
ncbi:hypothetical protein CLM85_11080 [Streptomyces albidoflavus]|nr:hypothetical protein CLM82_31240 [Streptomyces albidoflavus]PAX87101.1 hypothetical protein CLM81_07210 [Streptomyces albidoflavus]PBO17222.1 hypothetical protein CLM83_19415 [Streptomyces albidoflavus]PBO24306.1 hypothetical protein CLM85_11080 [Streptomyces albidoflavus]PBO27423.1 hypothetical protein CLM84_25805 [Streptomyces albidoflavus]